MDAESAAAAAEHVSQLRHRVDAALDRYSALGEGCPTHLREAIRHSLLAPGKRLRPLLVLLAAEACGGEAGAAMPAACAVEMVHTYSLVHDDLPAMDNDDLRRGLPTCHRAFGEATAILAGDGLLALAFETLARDIAPPAVAARCCAALGRAAGPCWLVGGQADDMAALPADAGREVLQGIHARKTGAMIEVSLRLGAIVAGADTAAEEALAGYGQRLGLAFQITDDLLDVRGHEADLGKRVQKDRQQGKLTFPAVLGVEESQCEAERLVAAACAELAPFGAGARPLVELARRVLERNR